MSKYNSDALLTDLPEPKRRHRPRQGQPRRNNASVRNNRGNNTQRNNRNKRPSHP